VLELVGVIAAARGKRETLAQHGAICVGHRWAEHLANVIALCD